MKIKERTIRSMDEKGRVILGQVAYRLLKNKDDNKVQVTVYENKVVIERMD